MPACRFDTLTNVLLHWNAIQQTQDMTPHPVTVYRHRADLAMYYPLMCNVTPEATNFYIIVVGLTQPRNPFTPKVRILLLCYHGGI